MYLVTATHYLTGIAPGILLIVPALEIFFDLRPGEPGRSPGRPGCSFYAGFYVMQIVLAFYTLGSFRWEVLMLAAVSFPIYISALWQRDHEEGAEVARHRQQGEGQSPFNFMIPQVLVFFFLLLTSVVSIWRDLGNGQLSLATAWNVTNTFILGAFMVVAVQGELAHQPPVEEPGARPGRAPGRRGHRDARGRRGHRAAASWPRSSGFPSWPPPRVTAPTTTDDDNDNDSVPARRRPRSRSDSDAKEVAAK